MKKILFLSLILGACTSGVSLQSVNYNNLLNDENSKVWMINQMVVNHVNIANGHDWNKDLMIFHETGRVELIPMKALGKSNPKKGHYYLDSDNKKLEITFPDEEWKMSLTYITEDSIYMKSTKESDVQYGIQLIPFPELQ